MEQDTCGEKATENRESMAEKRDFCEYNVAGPQFYPFNEGNQKENWRIWLRNFKYYLDGQIGLSDGQKIARLLHQAGPDVQEIYENIKDAPAAPTDKNDFEKCITRLNNYFIPDANIAYERQKFRNIHQQENESVEQFVIKLRKQARYCEFTQLEERLLEQIIDKTHNAQLKRKILKKGKEMTLKEALELAKRIEAEKDMIINPIHSPVHPDASVNKVEITCFRCGRRGHGAKDSCCPALSEKCDKCGIKGHFAKVCKTKLSDKNLKSNNKKKKRYVKYVIEEDSNVESSDEDDRDVKQEINSVFNINNKDQSGVCEIMVDDYKCKFIIDSGAAINIIDKYLYDKIKKSNVNCKLLKCTQKYSVYGGKPLPNLGIFVTDMFCKLTERHANNVEILVYDGSGPALLSKDTSITLGLLKLGPQVMVAYKTPLTKDNIMLQYPSLFNGIGKLKDFKLKIPIDKNITLVAQPIRRQPYSVRDIEAKLIDELLQSDIIEPVEGPTPCVSPSHIVKKKEEGQYRLVVDMRRANEAILRERVPLPTFEELLSDLNGCKYFSTLDIKWGYHQLELHEDSKVITVFSCSLGLFRYKRLFFGIRCASEMFQRVIANLLQGIKGVANSQDDIRIGGRTREEHDERLILVLERLHKSGITLNPKKCQFGVNEIIFLGHHISADGVKPTRSNQQVVQEFRAPENKAEVRSFLGLVNFSARFISDFSTLTHPLRELIKQDTEFSWDQTHQQAFQCLKDAISTAPALGFYDKDAETMLITDASPVGVAAVLVQLQNIKGQKQPIIIKYTSKALSPVEQRYSQTEKEALAIVWSCENLYMYLLGKDFTIISDHKPLEMIYSSKSKPSARLQRWVLRLQPFNFKVIYKPGKNNIADPVSRLLDVSNRQEIVTEDKDDSLLLAFIETSVKAVSLEEVTKKTFEDEELKNLKNAIETDIWTKDLRKYELIKNELCIVQGIILRGNRIVIPKELVPKLLELAHEGHIASNGMKSKLRSKVWWKSMDKDIEYWSDTCEGCQLVRKEIAPEPIQSTELPSRVWEQVAIDYLGPLPSGHYLLFVVDYYSRYYEVEITKHPTAENTITALRKIMAREGYMETMVTDNGPAFRDERFQNFLKDHNIHQRFTTPLWPQANGEVERQNRNVLRRLRIAQALKQDWKEELQTYLFAYRTTPHSTTGVPPGDIFRGRKIRTKIPELRPYNITYRDDEEVRDRDRYQKHMTKNYADQRRNCTENNLREGDKVLVKQKKENKLTTPFSPVEHTVVWKHGNAVAGQSPEGKIIRRNSSYFQPVKHRDMSRFLSPDHENNNRQNEDPYGEEEGERITCDTENKRETVGVTSNPDPSAITCDNKPKRVRHTPAKYKDYVLNLILECINNE